MRFFWIFVIFGWLFPTATALGNEVLNALKEDYRRPASIPFPKSNPYTAERVALGKLLFFDPRLSASQNMSCVHCHNPSFGWEMPTAKTVGSADMPLDRHSPTLLNLAWTEALFWDGRADSLETQVAGPLEAPKEMNMLFPDLVARLQSIKGYRSLFEKAYPGEGITQQTIEKAIATFERTLVSGPAPFDLWVEGDDSALTEEAKRGFDLFNGKAQCSNCHMGWNLTDNLFHDIGLPTNDPGRAGVTGDSDDQSAFKTPGLRNIAQRAPYMHNGSLATLSAVIDHYEAGGVQRDSVSAMMEPFTLSAQEQADLEAFLESLTGDDPPVTLPVLPQ